MHLVHTNKKLLTFLVVISLSILCFTFAKTKVLVPKNARAPIIINISNKSLKYYPLSVDEATILSARGPGKLKIITRGHLNSQSDQTLNYEVYYRIRN